MVPICEISGFGPRTIFGFLRHLTMLTPDEVRDGASKLIQAYPEDVEKDFEDELIQFSELLKNEIVSSDN